MRILLDVLPLSMILNLLFALEEAQCCQLSRAGSERLSASCPWTRFLSSTWVAARNRSVAEVTPWVPYNVFGPLESDGRCAMHVDVKDAPGVDLVAHITTANGRSAIRALGGPQPNCVRTCLSTFPSNQRRPRTISASCARPEDGSWLACDMCTQGTLTR